MTLLGISIDVSPVQPSKANSPKEVTLFGISVFLQPTTNLLDLVSIRALQFSLESKAVLSFTTTIDVSPGHPLKAATPIEVTLLGITTDVSL